MVQEVDDGPGTFKPSCRSLEKLDLVDFDGYMNVHTSAEPQHKAEL